MPVIGPGTGASAWSPQDGLPGSRLIAWYDFSDRSTITTDGSNGVSAVRDKSLNRCDLSQGTAGYRPTTGDYLGNPGLIFDGYNDYLQSVSFSQAQPLTVIGVARQSVKVGSTSRSLWDTISGDRVIFYNEANSRWVVYGGNAGFYGAVVDTLAHVHCGVWNGSTSAIYTDGNVGNFGSVGAATISAGVLIGGWQGDLNRSWVGWIGEVQYWDGALDVKNRRRLETYLGAKHNIPLKTSACSPPLVFL